VSRYAVCRYAPSASSACPCTRLARLVGPKSLVTSPMFASRSNKYSVWRTADYISPPSDDKIQPIYTTTVRASRKRSRQQGRQGGHRMEREWPQMPTGRRAARALPGQVDRQALVQDTNRASMGN
jgi:hypothetical protein